MEIKRVTVIGMGTMGSQIGIVCARGGYETAMVEVSSQLAEKGFKNIESFLKNQMKKGKMDPETHDRILSRIVTTTHLNEAVGASDLVIEAVFEDIEVKKALFKEMGTILKPDGRLFIVEPSFRVSKTEFEETIGKARAAGFKSVLRPKVFLSKAVILERGDFT